MLRKEKKLEEIVKNMRSVGKMLIPYNYPQAPLNFFIDDLEIFKEREIAVDGYSVIIHYQKADYGDYFLETLQVYNRLGPFLPFFIVLKVASRFLGPTNLSLVELLKDGKKIYCWSLALDKNNETIEIPYEIIGEECVFEGVKYTYVNPTEVNFY
jgi:hypothetical protein